MRGHGERSGSLFSYVAIEERTPVSHPLRRIRKLAVQALERLNPTFCELYAVEGRPSVPPEQWLLAIQHCPSIGSAGAPCGATATCSWTPGTLIVDCQVTPAVGTGERDAAKSMASDRPGAHQKTLGADKACDSKGYVADMHRIGVTPHLAQNTTRHEGYAKSINARRGFKKVFAWFKP